MSARQLSVANLNVSTSATMQRELPLPPPELGRRLKTAPLVITAVEGAGGGVMGAKKLTLFLADDQRPLEAKWKGSRVAILCVLDQEDHQERHDGGSRIDKQLPASRIRKVGSRRCLSAA